MFFIWNISLYWLKCYYNRYDDWTRKTSCLLIKNRNHLFISLNLFVCFSTYCFSTVMVHYFLIFVILNKYLQSYLEKCNASSSIPIVRIIVNFYFMVVCHEFYYIILILIKII
jgi:hypothetical protein